MFLCHRNFTSWSFCSGYYNPWKKKARAIEKMNYYIHRINLPVTYTTPVDNDGGNLPIK